jgi:hypothetical protein
MGGPIIIRGGGMGMGGGMGGSGLGSPLLTSLLAGGVGYALGSSNAQNAPQGQAPPPYPAAAPSYPVPVAPPAAPAPGSDTARLAQLQLLGDLRASGVLTDDEFEREKQRLLRSA